MQTKLHYEGSIFWLVFWLIFFFPIAFVLLLTDCTFEFNGKIHRFQYDGSRGWLCFWVLVFFPVAFLLLFINGYSIKSDNLTGSPENPTILDKEPTDEVIK